MKEKRTIKKMGAYFTVEAAMVFPIIMGALLFVIYFMFFQYNRCLMEQDAASLALKGAVLQQADKTKLMETLKQKEEEQNRDKYIAWKRAKTDIRLKGYKVSVRQTGRLIIDKQRRWEAQASYESTRMSPTFFIRSCRRLLAD
ncbi:MAG: hypothetical protein NC081_08415 [Roseburia sp.]|nr:hypothetical protein [Roseburia sp.]